MLRDIRYVEEEGRYTKVPKGEGERQSTCSDLCCIQRDIIAYQWYTEPEVKKNVPTGIPMIN